MAKILLVEDDNNLREIYQARLMAEGYEIIAAQDGEEALVLAKKSHPDLIVSDVMMPRISGFEMLDILRNTEELKHTKIIMLTALGQAEDQSRADNLGADRYLVKSQVTLEDIVKSAQELLAEDGVIPPPTEETATATPETVATEQPIATDSTAPAPVASPEAPIADTTPPVTPLETPSTQPASVASASLDNTSSVPAADPATSTQPAADTPVATTPAVNDPLSVPDLSAPQLTSDVSTPTPKATTPSEPSTPEAPVAVSAQPAATNPEPVATPALTEETTPPVVASPEPTATPEAADPTAPAALITPESTPATDSTSAAESTPVTPAVEAPAAEEAAVTESAPQSLEAEEDAIKKQIESFVESPEETTETVPPSDATAPTGAETTAANLATDDALIAEAVQDFDTNTPPAPEPTTPEPAPVVEPVNDMSEVSIAPPKETTSLNTENVTVAGKKIIQPLNSGVERPSLDELLAKEAAKDGPAPAAPIINGAPVPPPATGGQPFDPNSISL